MTWLSLEEFPLKQDCLCLVANSKGWMRNVMAIYHKRENVFVLYDPSRVSDYVLDVTHYIVIPTLVFD